MTTIQDREYVEKIEGRFHPTPLGMTVNDLLIESFDDIFNRAYTAQDGGRARRDRGRKARLAATLCASFTTSFPRISRTRPRASRTRRRCRSRPTRSAKNAARRMVIKFGRFGQFLACENYPECKNTREVASKKTDADGDGAKAAKKPKRSRYASSAAARWR